MSLSTFIHSDWATKRKKFVKWWHRNDWKRAHSPSLATRIKTEWYYLRHKDECLIVDGWLLKFYEAKELYMNWGDDINVYLLERLSGKKIIPAAKLLFRHKKYTCIGSVIPACVDKHTAVWGSGCMDFSMPIKAKGAIIKSVRGPLTREFLLKNGIDCPPIYGDPALLLPIVYNPQNQEKKYKMCIIPHHHDWDEPEQLKQFIKEWYPDAHVISMTDYKEWTNVIDEIVQSEIVISSSLHGLIVSDAYGVPNVFAEFTFHHPRYDKYKDYYMSVGREFCPPQKAECITLENRMRDYRQPNIDIQPILKACPFEISI